MKPVLLSDGIGIMVGHLCAPDQIQTEQSGVIHTYTLTGNVVDTKSYDVLAIGKMLDGDTFQVQKMESLPDAEYPFELYAEEIDGKRIEVAAFQTGRIREKTVRQGKNGKFTSLTVEAQKGLMYLNLFREEYAEPSTGAVCVLLLPRKEESGYGQGAVRREERSFGQGKAIKKVITIYAGGIQLQT